MNDAAENSDSQNTKQEIDPGKLSVAKLVGLLTVKQLYGLGAALLGLLVGAFLFGAFLTSNSTEGKLSSMESRLASKDTELANKQGEIDSLRRRIESQRVTHESQFSDVAVRLIDDQTLNLADVLCDADSPKPPNSVFFDEAGFYASNDTDSWQQSKSSEADLLKMLSKEKVGILDVAASRMTPIYLWRGKDEFDVGKNEFFKKVFRYCFVMPMSIKERLQAFESQLQREKYLSPEMVKLAIEQARTDPLLSMLSLVHAMYFDFAVKANGKFIVLSTEKSDDVLHARCIMMLKDVVVDERERRVFYIHYRFLFVIRGKEFFVVSTSNPSNEPFDTSGSHHVKKWLSSLCIVKDVGR